MKSLTFKEFLKGYYRTGECLNHDNRLFVKMRNLGWLTFGFPCIKRNKHYVPHQDVPEWFEEGSKTWDRDIRSCLKELGR